VAADISGTKSAHSLICRWIFWSHASPPRSSLSSNQASMPAARKPSRTRRAASASSEA
jgi:hypothetical protein